MLILGLVMQLWGDRSVLADSLERLKVMIAVSGSLYRATSMDCTVLKPAAGNKNPQYRVRWNTNGVTRADMNSAKGLQQTLWISKGGFSAVDSESGAASSAAIATLPAQWQPVMEFLTPSILAQHMERCGLKQAESQDGAGPNEFLLIGQGDQQVVEIAVDARTYLPTSLKKYLPAPAREGKQRICFEEVRFQWNQFISRELLVPGSSVLKGQVN
jgi:hypothetical protein